MTRQQNHQFTHFSSFHSLFLKCKNGSAGSAGAGNNSKDAEKSQQLAVSFKALQIEIQERKEDFEKLKQKLERLEVSESGKFVQAPKLIEFLGYSKGACRHVSSTRERTLPR